MFHTVDFSLYDKISSDLNSTEKDERSKRKVYQVM